MSSTYPPGQSESGTAMNNGSGSAYAAGGIGTYDDGARSGTVSDAYDATGRTTAKSSAAMRENLSSLKSDLDALLSRVTGMSETELHDAYDRILMRFRDMRSAASDMANQAGDQFNHRVEATTDYVKEKPLQSIGIAAGIGLLIGLLMRRR